MWYLSAKYARPACTGGKHNYIPHVGLVELVSVVLLLFLLAFDFCLFCVVIRFFHPRHMTSDLEGFLYQILSITLFSYLNSWERASIFPFECWVLNKSTTGTIFITYFVWRGPWLGIEPGTSLTQSHHSSTRLSRRRSLTGDWTRDLPHSKPTLFH